MDSSQLQQADLLIEARWIVPVAPRGAVLHDHAVVVRDGRIAALLPCATARAQWQAAQVRKLPRHALIPGLVNSHGHTPMSLLRGIADDLPLQTWLEDHVWPLENRLIGPEFVRDGALLAIGEMIRGGTTCFCDMYFFPDVVAECVAEAGMRAQLCSPILEFPSVWATSAEEYLRKARQLCERFREHPRIQLAFGPHAPYTVGDSLLRATAAQAAELEAPIHMHVHETATEVAEALRDLGQRPLARLAGFGLLGPRFQCVHATQLLDAEIELLASTGASVMHCPESNLKLASGACRVAELLAVGVNVALGTDGAASNNDLDMFGEMRTAALLGKLVANDAAALPAPVALEMATLNGARALGIDGHAGSIEVGKCADLTAVRLDCFNSSPQYDVCSHLVYAAQSSQVSDVWCAGRALLENGHLQTIDTAGVLATAKDWQQRVLATKRTAARQTAEAE